MRRKCQYCRKTSVFPAGDPCQLCQAWAQGFTDGGRHKTRAARWGLGPFALEGSNSGDAWAVSTATAKYAEAWRSLAIQEVETMFNYLPSFPRFRRRFKRVLNCREEYLDPGFWAIGLDRYKVDLFWLFWDALAMDKRCFMIYILTPGLEEDWVNAGPVGYAASQHSFTREELLPLLGSACGAVRAMGLKLMGTAKPARKGRAR